LTTLLLQAENMPLIPVVTIVTPSCNQGEFLAETIESVISQEGEFAIDYIIMDGASTDNSLEIIEHYESMLQRGEWPIRCQGISFRWLSEKDKGQTDALIKGFSMAKGEILAWLNSDDTYLPGALQAAAGFFRDLPDTGLLYGDAHYCDTKGAIIGRYRTGEFDLNALAAFNFICQPSTFFRRDVFEKVGSLDESLHFAMDYDLWIRIGKSFPCRYLKQFLSKYRLHEASKTIRDDALRENIEAGLRVAIKYYDWAPLTRVYALCHCSCKSTLPVFVSRSRLLTVCAALICTVLRSLWLNRGLRLNDLKLLNRSNFSKLFKSRSEVLTGNISQQ
jgi:glycosyltransferase involved in cell wall biosynthesis